MIVQNAMAQLKQFHFNKNDIDLVWLLQGCIVDMKSSRNVESFLHNHQVFGGCSDTLVELLTYQTNDKKLLTKVKQEKGDKAEVK